ncbi:mitochondrial ribosomal protein L12 [Oratosquilla oratoria]|uniref:mitochondrial ribosomal protein L12 n=1 Tax=Oratosquilla oratoria TaxID=337810 RepID=UPI003F761DAD
MRTTKILKHLSYCAQTSLSRCKNQHLYGMARVVQAKRSYSAEPIEVSSPEGAFKVYPEKIQGIVSEISKLTLVEVADLNELLKKTLNISEAPIMAAAAPVAAAAQEEEEEEDAMPKAVQTSFTIKMLKYDETKKVPTIKQVKALIEGMNLVQAKKFVESCPAVVKADIPKDEAEKLKETLESVGAECVIE